MAVNVSVTEYPLTDIEIKKIKFDPANPNVMTDQELEQMRESMKEFGFLEPVIVDQNYVIADGEHRVKIYKEFGRKTIQAYQVTCKNDAQRRFIRQIKNKLHGEHDLEKDVKELELLMQANPFGLEKLLNFDNDDLTKMQELLSKQNNLFDEVDHDSLVSKYGAPPFSVLDARQQYWMERKDYWHSFGIKSEKGRDNDLVFGYQDYDSQEYLKQKSKHGSSIFDPVLAEIIYKWFSQKGDHVLDPFAGGSVRGIIAAALGRQYYGVDLSKRQVEENEKQLKDTTIPKSRMRFEPVWLHGNSLNISKFFKTKFNLLASCPPYFNLEQYTDDPQDLSNLAWPQFLAQYYSIIKKSCELLKDNSFAVFVVGDVRDKQGFYRNLVWHTVQAFEKAGLGLYNQLILLTPLGTAPMRAPPIFIKKRKVVLVHQYVLVFYKGNVNKILPYR